MAHTINIELLQLLEDKLGKEEGRKVAEAIEIGLEVIEKKAEAVALQKKLELRDELTKELATKADLLVLSIVTLRQAHPSAGSPFGRLRVTCCCHGELVMVSLSW